jgi:hypothetical protein
MLKALQPPLDMERQKALCEWLRDHLHKLSYQSVVDGQSVLHVEWDYECL